MIGTSAAAAPALPSGSLHDRWPKSPIRYHRLDEPVHLGRLAQHFSYRQDVLRQTQPLLELQPIILLGLLYQPLEVVADENCVLFHFVSVHLDEIALFFVRLAHSRQGSGMADTTDMIRVIIESAKVQFNRY